MHAGGRRAGQPPTAQPRMVIVSMRRGRISITLYYLVTLCLSVITGKSVFYQSYAGYAISITNKSKSESKN